MNICIYFLLTKTGKNCCIPLMRWDPIDDHPVYNQGCSFLDQVQKFTCHPYALLQPVRAIFMYFIRTT